MIAASKVGVSLLVALVFAQWWSIPGLRRGCPCCWAWSQSGHPPARADADISHLIISKSPDCLFRPIAPASIAIVATFALHGLRRRPIPDPKRAPGLMPAGLLDCL
jgi:hypothetical protein